MRCLNGSKSVRAGIFLLAFGPDVGGVDDDA
jgi:hypothetical protein